MERFTNVPKGSKKNSLQKINCKNCISSFLQIVGNWQNTSPIYKINFLKAIHGFNENLTNYEDLELAAKSIYRTDKYVVFNNIDSYYRNDENYRAKYHSKEAADKSIKSFIVFIKSIQKEIINKEKDKKNRNNYCQDIIIGYKTIFLQYIKENVKEYKKQNKIIINFFKHHNYLTNKQYILFFFTQNVLFKFYKIKRIGLFRFIKYLYKL